MQRKFVVLVLILAGLAMSACSGDHDGPQAPAAVLETPRPLTPFTLQRYDQPDLNLAALKGKWTFMFFGYTHCPDVCPTTLTELSAAYELLSHDPGVLDDTQFVFVSVDPERDTPQSLATYVGYFNKAFIGATGTPKELAAITPQLDIRYRRGEPTADGGYVMNHSSAMLLIDPQVRYYARFKAPHYSEKIRSQFLAIRHYYEGQQ
jgi:protein SCO1/2